jgi:hypothetical protein
MSRILNRPIPVRRDRDGRPGSFLWRGRWWRVGEILEEWVYRPPWWEEQEFGERCFYRVLVEGGGVFELLLEAGGSGRLYREFD